MAMSVMISEFLYNVSRSTYLPVFSQNHVRINIMAENLHSEFEDLYNYFTDFPYLSLRLFSVHIEPRDY
jgi:hypothetical protein